MKYPALKPKQRVAVRALGILAVALCALPLHAHARTWPATVGEGSISRWSDDKVAAFSLTIDDNYVGELPYWLGLGNQYAMDWTWFLITSEVESTPRGGTWAEWQGAVDQGHCIGSHSVSHMSINYALNTNLTPAEVEAEYKDSQIALQANLTANDALVFAYPFGNKPPNDPALAADYYVAARGVVGGVNTGNSINYMDTHSISMSSSTIPLVVDPGAWMYYRHLLNPSHQYYEGWYNVHFHSVVGLESGVTNMLDALASDEADMWVGTFQQITQYGQERENSTLTVTSVSGSEIRFTVTDTVDNSLFYFPLTVKIRVDSAWNSVEATQNGTAVSVELVENGGNSYALVQAVPDRGEVVLRQGSTGGGPGLFFVLSTVPRNQIWVDGDFTGSVSSGSYHAPYKTVQAGLDAAAPGMKVSVREGTYREQITLPSGTAGKPITLAAAAGERVVLNTMVPMGGWQAETGGLYSTTTGWTPDALYSGFSKMALARVPNEGWWAADSVSENVPSNTVTITDASNLAGLSNDLTGASVYLWTQGTDRFFTCPVVSFDPVLGKVEFEKVDASMAPAAGDKYWLQNQPSLIDLPGEWASVPEGGVFRIHFLPEDFSVLAKTQAPPASGRVVTGQNVAHVRLDGLEIAGGSDLGILLQNVQDIEISRCIIHDNMQYGIGMVRTTDCTVRNSVLVNNRFGLIGESSTNLVVEGCEIGNNSEDGLVFSWGSSNVAVRRNHIHHHLLWGHPDNSQTYRGVDGIQYLENLIVAGGQSVMMKETTDAEFSGNMVVGSAANMLNFDPGTLTNTVAIHGNTLACSGYSNLGMTGTDGYDVQENIFMPGHGSAAYTVTDTLGYQGDRNLFWNGGRLVDPTILISDGAWGGGVPELFNVVYDCHSLAAGSTSAAGTSSHADMAIGNLSLPGTFPPSNWPNALTALQNSAGINSLATAISSDDYFTFTVTPDTQTTASYTNLHVRISLGANAQPATTVFTLMSSLTGFTSADALAAFTNETLTSSTFGIENDLDLGGISALQNVATGTVAEFRLYAHNIGANPMTRLGIGKAFGAAADDLRLSGIVSSGSGGGSSETIYHTSLATFQTTTGQDLNSTNSDPLFVNAPFGINVMDSALLHQATRDTFALRDTNGFLAGDHVEINFDGVVRTVTASSGATVTIDPPLAEKPLKGYLIANWGTNTNFTLDLELQSGSPGIGLGQGGGTIGSPVSIQQYQNGDFDGDGQRDLPEIPADLVP